MESKMELEEPSMRGVVVEVNMELEEASMRGSSMLIPCCLDSMLIPCCLDSMLPPSHHASIF